MLSVVAPLSSLLLRQIRDWNTYKIFGENNTNKKFIFGQK